MGKTRKSILLESEVSEKIDKLAALENTSPNQYMVKALAAYMNRSTNLNMEITSTMEMLRDDIKKLDTKLSLLSVKETGRFSWLFPMIAEVICNHKGHTFENIKDQEIADEIKRYDKLNKIFEGYLKARYFNMKTLAEIELANYTVEPKEISQSEFTGN